MTLHIAEVVELFPDGNCADIAAMLRMSANSIESEGADDSPTRAMVGVQIHECGAVQVYGWGKVDSLQALGILQLGISKVIAQMQGGEE